MCGHGNMRLPGYVVGHHADNSELGIRRLVQEPDDQSLDLFPVHWRSLLCFGWLTNTKKPRDMQYPTLISGASNLI